MRETLRTINQMQHDGVIGKYAIGGAVGAIFYIETFYTDDLDVFVSLPTAPGSALLSLSPIYDYLSAKGCMSDGERILLGDWPVQFLPTKPGLEQEALDTSREIDYEGVPAFVFGAEYLVAICLQTGRPKDYARISAFVEQDAVNMKSLNELLAKHGLLSAWATFQQKYL